MERGGLLVDGEVAREVQVQAQAVLVGLEGGADLVPWLGDRVRVPLRGAYELLVSRAEQPARSALAARIGAALPDRSAEDVAAAADGAFDLLVAATVVRGLTSGLVDADAFCARTAESLALLVAAERTPAV